MDQVDKDLLRPLIATPSLNGENGDAQVVGVYNSINGDDKYISPSSTPQHLLLDELTNNNDAVSIDMMGSTSTARTTITTLTRASSSKKSVKFNTNDNNEDVEVDDVNGNTSNEDEMHHHHRHHEETATITTTTSGAGTSTSAAAGVISALTALPQHQHQQQQEARLHTKHSDGNLISFNQKSFRAAKYKPIVFTREEKLRYLYARAYIMDALHGKFVVRKEDAAAVRFYRIWDTSLRAYLTRIWVILHLCLILFEAPAYYFKTSSGRVVSFELPAWGVALIEMVFLCPYFAEIWLRSHFLAPGEFWRRKRNVVYMVVTVLVFVSCIVQGLCSALYPPMAYFKIATLLRPFFLVYHTYLIYNTIINIFQRTLPQVIEVLVLVMALVLFFGLAGYLFLVDDGSFFATPLKTLDSLGVLLTTENFPDVMLDAYYKNQFAGLFFVSFLIIGTFSLMNLVLATVYSKYREGTKHQVIGYVKNQTAGLNAAFAIIEQAPTNRIPGQVSYETFRRMIKVLRPLWSEEVVRIAFEAMDTEKDDGIDATEWLNIAKVLNMIVVQVGKRRNLFQECMPRFYNSRPVTLFNKFIKGRVFSIMVDLTVLLHFIFFMVVLLFQYKIRDEAAIIDSVIMIEVGFTALFLLEQLVKLFAHGPFGLWKNRWLRFDFIVIMIKTVLFLVWILFMRYRSTNKDVLHVDLVLRVLLISQTLRVLRVLFSLKRFRLVVNAVYLITPALFTFWALLFVTFYVFATVGMWLFAGKISDTGPMPALAGTEFDQSNYYILNFNNVAHSFMTLFALMVVNNWYVLMDAFALVTSNWARLYFFIFYFFTVVIILNLVIAFIIETYMMQYDAVKLEREEALKRKQHKQQQREQSGEELHSLHSSLSAPTSPTSSPTAPVSKQVTGTNTAAAKQTRASADNDTDEDDEHFSLMTEEYDDESEIHTERDTLITNSNNSNEDGDVCNDNDNDNQEDAGEEDEDDDDDTVEVEEHESKSGTSVMTANSITLRRKKSEIVQTLKLNLAATQGSSAAEQIMQTRPRPHHHRTTSDLITPLSARSNSSIRIRSATTTADATASASATTTATTTATGAATPVSRSRSSSISSAALDVESSMDGNITSRSRRDSILLFKSTQKIGLQTLLAKMFKDDLEQLRY